MKLKQGDNDYVLNDGYTLRKGAKVTAKQFLNSPKLEPIRGTPGLLLEHPHANQKQLKVLTRRPEKFGDERPPALADYTIHATDHEWISKEMKAQLTKRKKGGKKGKKGKK